MGGQVMLPRSHRIAVLAFALLVAVPASLSFAQIDLVRCPKCGNYFPAGHPHFQPVAAESKERDGDVAKHRIFALPEGHFRCELPVDWVLIRDARADTLTHTYGVYVFQPRVLPVRPAVSVRYYARENILFPSAEHYLKRQLEDGLFTRPKEKTSEPTETKLGGLRATTFTRGTFDYYPPRSLDAQEIPVREECFVVELEDGFFVLRYKSPMSSFDRYRPAFQHVLDTFQHVR
jgi:hypothetical protein